MAPGGTAFSAAADWRPANRGGMLQPTYIDTRGRPHARIARPDPAARAVAGGPRARGPGNHPDRQRPRRTLVRPGRTRALVGARRRARPLPRGSPIRPAARGRPGAQLLHRPGGRLQGVAHGRGRLRAGDRLRRRRRCPRPRRPRLGVPPRNRRGPAGLHRLRPPPGRPARPARRQRDVRPAPDGIARRPVGMHGRHGVAHGRPGRGPAHGPLPAAAVQDDGAPTCRAACGWR